jgi:hypothetical protein
MTILQHFLVRVPDRQNFSIFPYIHYGPMACRKDFYPMIIVYFEDKVKGFSKRISLYFMNAWFERYPKLKLTNFGQMSKICQLKVLVTPWGI